MIGIKGLRSISMVLVRIYVLIFLLGLYMGYSGFGLRLPDIPRDASPILLHEISWALSGALFGMLWLGIGPLLALYYLGLQNGGLLGSYLSGGGAIYFREEYVTEGIGANTMALGAGLMESLAFLYASVGGMYLAMYCLEIFDSGVAVDETQRINFSRKMFEGLLIAMAAAGMRLVAL